MGRARIAAAQKCRVSGLFDVHPRDEPIPKSKAVDDESFSQEQAVPIMNHLAHTGGQRAVRSPVERLRLDARAQHLPLAHPIVAHGVMAADTPALPGIRPVDVSRHRREDNLDVAIVEGRVADPHEIRGISHLPTLQRPSPRIPATVHGACTAPNLGVPPRPLFDVAGRLGIRWLSYDRPGYGGSSPDPGRDVASAARNATVAADALSIDRFATMGHSGGGPHALACGALLGDRVIGAVTGASPAPFNADGLDWFAGMAASAVASLRAAAAGRAEKERFEGSGVPYDPEFTRRHEAALARDWSWLLDVVRPAVAAGPAALIDDDLAVVKPVGIRPGGRPATGAAPPRRGGSRHPVLTRRVACPTHPARHPLALSCGRTHLRAQPSGRGARVAGGRSEAMTRASRTASTGEIRRAAPSHGYARRNGSPMTAGRGDSPKGGPPRRKPPRRRRAPGFGVGISATAGVAPYSVTVAARIVFSLRLQPQTG